MQALRDGRARVCVATDVAARGIDLPTRPRHPRRTAPRRRGAAASLRPHRPRRPQGRQRHPDAVRAPAQRRTPVRRGGHRAPLGRTANRRRSARARRRALHRRSDARGAAQRGRSRHGAPIDRRAQPRRDRCGAGAALSRAAAGDRGGHRSRRASARQPPAAGLQRASAPRARPAPEDRDFGKPARTGPASTRSAAARGFASTSGAPRAPIRNGSCR